MDNLAHCASVPLIVTVVYTVLGVYKNIVTGKEIYIKIIPAIAGILGIGIGVAMFYLAPEMIPATNIITAILLGGASGLAATGTNQLIKQLKPLKTEEPEDKPEDRDTE